MRAWWCLVAGACAAPAASGPQPLDCTPVSQTFRIDQVHVPVTSDEALRAGLDLDGDGYADNDAGAIAGAMTNVIPDLQATWDARFTGDTDWRVRIDRCNGEARVYLSGGAAFEMVAAAGEDRGGAITARDGVGVAPLGALFELDGRGSAGWQPAASVAVALTIDGDQLGGRIGGGFAPPYQRALAAAMQPALQAALSAGDAAVASFLDDNGDGVLTIDELLSVLAVDLAPDLDTDGDGAPESYSFGLEVHATAL